jgi:hypothetical protein
MRLFSSTKEGRLIALASQHASPKLPLLITAFNGSLQIFGVGAFDLRAPPYPAMIDAAMPQFANDACRI